MPAVARVPPPAIALPSKETDTMPSLTLAQANKIAEAALAKAREM